MIFIYDEWNDWKSNCNIAMAALGLVGVTVIIAEVKGRGRENFFPHSGH